MKEYIVPVQDDERDFEEVFVGHIRKQTELIRCKDCEHYSIAENGVNGVCNKLFVPFDSYEWCSRAERREE